MDTLTRQRRRPRFRRHRFGNATFVLQERDRNIIRLVSEHRVISSDDIQLLVAGSDQVVLRRLQKLFHHRYLDRPRSQRQKGNSPMVYALGQKGADLLAVESGQRPRADWAEKNRQLGAQYLEHALMVSRFQAALRFALRTNGSAAALGRWLPDGVVRDSVVVEHEASTERIPIAPDALFTVKLLREPDGRNRIHAFLEADRGTMTTKRFLTKLRGYWYWWRAGRQERVCVKNFQVLTITRTAERAASLRRVAAELDAPRHRGLRMFLFGSEELYAQGQALRILDTVWRTPADDTMHSLLE